MKSMWNNRYASDEYVYGIHPNIFFKDKIEGVKPGKILLPAEGEGRNAVYAAGLSWDVYAFDFSSKAREKALHLSKENKVSIQYAVHGMEEADYEKESFDVILAFNVLHLFKDTQKVMQRINELLKQGGLFISSTVCLAEKNTFLAFFFLLLTGFLGYAQHIDVKGNRHEVSPLFAGETVLNMRLHYSKKK